MVKPRRDVSCGSKRQALPLATGLISEYAWGNLETSITMPKDHDVRFSRWMFVTCAVIKNSKYVLEKYETTMICTLSSVKTAV